MTGKAAYGWKAASASRGSSRRNGKVTSSGRRNGIATASGRRNGKVTSSGRRSANVSASTGIAGEAQVLMQRYQTAGFDMFFILDWRSLA